MSNGIAVAVSYKWVDLFNHAKRNNIRGTAKKFDADFYTLSVIKERGLLV